jgi:tripartite-type tricarboxylate transporter receptor subunit TctC
VIIENKAGASTVIGTEYVAAQLADGYTLLLCTPGLAINPSLYQVHYDPGRSFTYVNLLAALPLILVAHPDLPVTNVNELIALAKSKPGVLSYSSYGMGSASHIAAELLQQMTGATMLHIPFKGSSAAVTEVVAGRTQLSFTTVPMVMPMIRAGRVKAMGVTTSQRLEVLREVPTIGETLPGFEVTSWLGLCAPAGLPNEIVRRLNKATNEIVNAPESRMRLAEAGYVVAGGTPGEFRTFVLAETHKWSTLIREANVKLE